MSQVDEAVLDLTVGEASFLADVLGVAPPPGLVDPDDEALVIIGEGGRSLTGSAVKKVAEVVAPGLIERRLVDGEGTVAAPVADLLTVVGSPHLVARAAYESGGEMEVRAFTARPEMAVEQRRLADGRVRFSPFDPAQLVPRILEFVLPNRVDASVGGEPPALGGEPEADVDAVPPLVIDCSVAVLDAMFASDPMSPETATAILVSDGVAPAAAELLAGAVCTIQATGSVTMLLRPVDDAVHGVELTWMDAGSNGLWLTEPSSDPGRRSVERITMQQL
ncbi:MAG: hypothetical protein OES24_23690, partial [Acidimicrobiia bacterium]|nr:hypothetical protein [Acidimicrobiia bacterium]